MLGSVRTLFSRSSKSSPDEKQKVIINVYDMLQPSFLTSLSHILGVGIYHSGVEIHGHEYCFGGHDYQNITGVFAVEAKVGPPGLLYKTSIHVGYTTLSEEAVEQTLKELSKDFVGPSYNLLTRNCNHFTDALIRRLVNTSAPRWINRAAKLGAMIPCMIPTEWVGPPELKPVSAEPVTNNRSPSTTLSYTSITLVHSTSARDFYPSLAQCSMETIVPCSMFSLSDLSPSKTHRHSIPPPSPRIQGIHDSSAVATTSLWKDTPPSPSKESRTRIPCSSPPY